MRRTAGDPLDVFVLTNMPTEGVLVDEVTTWEELMLELAGPVREMEHAGILPLDWPGRETVLAGLRLTKAAGVHGGETPFGSGSVTTRPRENGCMRRWPRRKGKHPSRPAARARRVALLPVSARLHATVRAGFGEPRACQPRAVLEALMGQLDLFEPSVSARAARAHRAGPVTPAAVASPVTAVELRPAVGAPPAASVSLGRGDGSAGRRRGWKSAWTPFLSACLR
jgi:hypothetical protein